MDAKIAILIAKLEQKETEWQEASDFLHEDEPDDMDTVENDAMSSVYGEAADFLRTALAEFRKH